MDKKAKKSEYNRKFREIQKKKLENETVKPKEPQKVKEKVEVKPIENNFFFQKMKNKVIETAIMLLIPISMKMIPILISRISSATNSKTSQHTSQNEQNEQLNIISMETNF
jgi:hypothetical protein